MKVKKKTPENKCFVCESKGRNTLATTTIDSELGIIPVCKKCEKEAVEFILSLEE